MRAFRATVSAGGPHGIRSHIIGTLGDVVDLIGVVAIVVGVSFALIDAGVRLIKRNGAVYERFRRVLGRAILIGLELLVAADIVRTVAVTPTLESVTVLGIIVLIRTFLSWSLQLEVSGRWPWQRARREPTSTPTPDSAGL